MRFSDRNSFIIVCFLIYRDWNWILEWPVLSWKIKACDPYFNLHWWTRLTINQLRGIPTGIRRTSSPQNKLVLKKSTQESKSTQSHYCFIERLLTKLATMRAMSPPPPVPVLVIERDFVSKLSPIDVTDSVGSAPKLLCTASPPDFSVEYQATPHQAHGGPYGSWARQTEPVLPSLLLWRGADSVLQPATCNDCALQPPLLGTHY